MLWIRRKLAEWLREQARLVNNGQSWLSRRPYPHPDNDARTVFFWRLSKLMEG